MAGPHIETVRAAIILAARAPSVHNTRPWRWLTGDHTLHLVADWTRDLPAPDPDGRLLLISCGAALHHLRVALAAFGWHTEVHRIPNGDPVQLAAVEPYPHLPSEQDIALVAAIRHRRTDRRGFSSRPVPLEYLRLLVRTASQAGARLVPVTDPHTRSRFTSAIAEAAGHQDDDRDDNAGELLVLTTSADDPDARLRAGEATSAVLLTATGLNLAGLLVSQTLQIASTRADVQRHVLHDTAVPQLILRLGWAPAPLTDTAPATGRDRRPPAWLTTARVSP